MLKLNNRLDCVQSFIENEKSIIDVGCDHALLSIYVSLNKNPKKVIASDIKEGPLVHAKKNIKKYKVEDKIIVRHGPGIETIDDDIDTIVISGIGGLNMVGILKYKKNLYKNVDTIILSPNSDSNYVRKEITKLGYYIFDENLVEDNNIIYPVICFKKGKKRYKYSDYLYGPILIQKKGPLFTYYLLKEKEKKQKIYDSLPKKYIGRKLELKKELNTISKIL